MKRIFRVGLVGAGYVSNHHLRALRDLPFVKVVAICDCDHTRARQMAAKYGAAGVYGSVAEMAIAEPDVIHVLTPPESHCALALEALDIGCHVFVEKPMAESVRECDQMIQRAREKGRVLSVNHSARFDPVVMRALELARSGACGDILSVHFIRSSDYPPYAGGALPQRYRQVSYPFRDLGVHGVYLLEAFLGPLERLDVRWAGTGRDPLIAFDEWRAHAEAANRTGYMFLSWNARPIQNELLIHGTRGVLHVDCLLQTCELNPVRPGPKQIALVFNGTVNAARRLWNVPFNVARFATGSLKPSPGIYRAVQDFYHALAAGAPPPVAPEEGRRAIELVSCGEIERLDCEMELRRAAALQSALEPAQILVTGANGFLGIALVARLRQANDPIRLLLRRTPAPGSPADPNAPGCPVSIVYGSLGQTDVVDRAVAGVKLIYHVGAAMRGSAADFEQGTIWGTRNIVEAAIRHSVRRLVYTSSLSVLDHAGHAAGQAVVETAPLEPFPERRGTYTRAKMEAEAIVLDAMRKRGLPAVIIRPGQIFGPGAERVTPNGVIQIAGKWIVAGGGRRQLPLVYRDDVVDALLLAAESDTALGQIINVVDTTPIRQNEYLQRCRPALGSIKVWKVPVPLLMLSASMIEVLGAVLRRRVPLSRYSIRSLRPLSPFDVSAAGLMLGWKPRVGVAEGLRRTFGS
jgi:predicted dehydrogenase/nucleoside-diphosphate-sugar epimerase